MSDVPRCPKCKQQNYSLAVVTEEEFTSEVVNGQISGCAASSLPSPVRAYGSCTNCGHKWRIKSAAIRTLNSYGNETNG